MSEKPAKVEAVDLATIQNHQLQQENLVLKEQVLKSEIEKAQLMRRQAAINAMQFFAVFEAKYGFSPMKNPERLNLQDGTITYPEQQEGQGATPPMPPAGS